MNARKQRAAELLAAADRVLCEGGDIARAATLIELVREMRLADAWLSEDARAAGWSPKGKGSKADPAADPADQPGTPAKGRAWKDDV